MYKVIVYFEDLQDNRYAYHVGDKFPRDGVSVSKKRLEELSTKNNKRRMPLIEEVVKAPEKAKVDKTIEESVEGLKKGSEEAVEVSEDKPKRRGRKK